MNPFDDAVDRQISDAQSASENAATLKATAARIAAESGNELAAKLRELADHLRRHVQPTRVQLHSDYIKGMALSFRRWGRAQYSPLGFPLNVSYDSSNVIVTSILMPDGQLWSYSYFGMNRAEAPIAGRYIDIAKEFAESASDSFLTTRTPGLSIGGHNFYANLQTGELFAEFGGGFGDLATQIAPIDALAKIAMQIRQGLAGDGTTLRDLPRPRI